MDPVKIESIKELTELLEQNENPVLLFKHSTRCPISFAAEDQYLRFADNYDGNVILTHLDLIAHRDVSAKIAELTGVEHQSPQAILVANGVALWNASHSSITETALTEAVNS